ncbi:hypothetical protein ACFQ2C_02725 [Sphingobacterium daejeonense]|jgi:hypothetical protein|uniref:GLPGLI family protein n=1 Tax=Sphingobacterium daejeonense TaxID=371142 RepID=A0ABW3RHC9_9SPHI|nr:MULTISPECIES: hypothetical protein [Sphingobacterium]VTP92031.1 Uncharacterised protein [Sphingobacterium daejeonense]
MIRLKHIISTLFLIWIACFVANGQSRQERFEQIENQKTAYITKQLRLTPTEAQKFFPLYNQYTKEIRSVKSKKSRGNQIDRTRGNSFRPGNDAIEFDAQEVDIKKKYRAKFADVVGQSRASQFFSVEQEFIELLYKELNSRRQH